MKWLAVVRLAGVGGAIRRLLDRALFKRDANPCQGQSDQRIAHHY
ncbi:MAG: hypothetical protein ABL932_01830 [Terricaulis sp.]